MCVYVNMCMHVCVCLCLYVCEPIGYHRLLSPVVDKGRWFSSMEGYGGVLRNFVVPDRYCITFDAGVQRVMVMAFGEGYEGL